MAVDPAVLALKLEKLDAQVKIIDHSLANGDAELRRILTPVRESLGRIRDASVPGAFNPTPEHARLFLQDVAFVQNIDQGIRKRSQ